MHQLMQAQFCVNLSAQFETQINNVGYCSP